MKGRGQLVGLSQPGGGLGLNWYVLSGEIGNGCHVLLVQGQGEIDTPSLAEGNDPLIGDATAGYCFRSLIDLVGDRRDGHLWVADESSTSVLADARENSLVLLEEVVPDAVPEAAFITDAGS